MAETKTKFKLGNEELDVWNVPFEATERWTEIKLEDGAVVRIKPVIAAVLRVEGKVDDQGNPVYVIRSTNASMTVAGPTAKSNGPKKAN
jgi:hypothetical protein